MAEQKTVTVKVHDPRRDQDFQILIERLEDGWRFRVKGEGGAPLETSPDGFPWLYTLLPSLNITPPHGLSIQMRTLWREWEENATRSARQVKRLFAAISIKGNEQYRKFIQRFPVDAEEIRIEKARAL